MFLLISLLVHMLFPLPKRMYIVTFICPFNSHSFFSSPAKCHFFREALPVRPRLYPLAKPNHEGDSKLILAWRHTRVPEESQLYIGKELWRSVDVPSSLCQSLGPCAFSGSLLFSPGQVPVAAALLSPLETVGDLSCWWMHGSLLEASGLWGLH